MLVKLELSNGAPDSSLADTCEHLVTMGVQQVRLELMASVDASYGPPVISLRAPAAAG
jgi:hypothetical protein